VSGVATVGASLVEVRLYGDLAARFGRLHRLAVGSVREACQALSVIVPGFERFMLEHQPGFHVFVGEVARDRDSRGADDVDAPVGRHEPIHIVPVVAGAKRQGTWQIIVGVILIAAAAVVTNGASLSFSGAAVGGLWGTVSAIGVSMAIGGVVQMLTPQRKSNAAAADDASRNFGEAATSAGQGMPVPLTIGRLFVRGIPVSAGLSTDDLSVGFSGPAPNPAELPSGSSLNPLNNPEEFSGGEASSGEGSNGDGTSGDNGGED
jgi:predicted phage tail protein